MRQEVDERPVPSPSHAVATERHAFTRPPEGVSEVSGQDTPTWLRDLVERNRFPEVCVQKLLCPASTTRSGEAPAILSIGPSACVDKAIIRSST